MKKQNKIAAHRPFWLLLAFCAAVAVRFLLCPKNATVTIFGDELRYWSISSAIFAGEGVAIHHMAVDYQKLFTALIYLPAHLVSGVQAQFHLAFFINCLWMASGIFPLWLLSRKILKSERLSALVVGFYLISPDFVATSTFMSESNQVPMALWYFLLLSKIFSLPNDKRRLPWIFGAGALCWLLYFSKETSGAYLVAWLALCGMSVLRERFRNLLPMLAVAASYAAGFLLPFLLLKATLFRSMGNSYHQSGIEALFAPGAVPYLLYAFVMQLVSCAVAFYVLPVIVPALFFQKLLDAEQKLAAYGVTCFVLFCGVVAYCISVRETLGLLAVRPYTRYFSGALYLLLVLLLRCVELAAEAKAPVLSRRKFYVGAGAAALVALIGRNCSISCYADSFLLNHLVYLPSFFSPEKLDQAIRVAQKLPAFLGLERLLQSGAINAFTVGKIICVAFGAAAFGLLWLLHRRPKHFLRWFAAFFAVVALANNVLSYLAVDLNCAIDDEEAAAAQTMAQTVSALDGTVVLLEGSMQTNLADSYFDLPNVYPMRTDLLPEDFSGTLQAGKIVEPYGSQVYNLNQVDYILVLGDHEETPVQLQVENAQPIEVPGAQGMLLYRNLDPAALKLSTP